MATPALERLVANAADEGRLCGVCQTAIAVGEEIGRCPACEAPFHLECWSENGGCATYGCAQMPETVKSEVPVAPQAFWGQEEKSCPSCGQIIKAAALRCRHCGTVFEDRAPISKTEHQLGLERAERKDALQLRAWAVFVLGIIPVTAPIALVVGACWYLAGRREIAKLGSTYRVLTALGTLAALVSVACLALGLLVSLLGS